MLRGESIPIIIFKAAEVPLLDNLLLSLGFTISCFMEQVMMHT